MSESKNNLRVLRLFANVNIVTAMIAFLFVVVLCVILHIARDIFIPLITGWFIMQILRPVNRLGNKLHLHPYFNMMLSFLILGVVAYIGGRFISSLAVDFNDVYTRYSVTLRERYQDLLLSLNITPEIISKMNWTTIGFDFLKSSTGRVVNFLVDFSNKFFMTIFFLMFMLVEAPYVERKIDLAFQGKTGSKIKGVLNAISSQVSNYMINQTALSLATALCVWFILSAMDVELANVWAVLTFFLNFIPNIGSIIATILPVVMSFIQFPTVFEPLFVLVTVTAVQMVIGNVIGPKVLSDSLGVSPVVILLFLLFWGMIWGIAGAFLSVPIASIIKIVCENVAPLKPIAVMMGNGYNEQTLRRDETL